MRRTGAILCCVGALSAGAAVLGFQATPSGGDAAGRHGSPPRLDSELRAELDASAGETELSPEFIDRCLRIAGQIDPDLANRLREMCDHDPAEFARAMATSGRKLVGLAQLQQRDPDLYAMKLGELRWEAQVERTARQLEDALRSGDEREAARITQDLRQHVLMQEAMRIKAQGDYLRRLEEHVQALREQIQREGDTFEQNVERRFKEIVSRSRATADARRD
jgi:hypothetical protein